MGVQQLHGLVQPVDGQQVGRCLQVLLLQTQLLNERLHRPSPRLEAGWRKKTGAFNRCRNGGGGKKKGSRGPTHRSEGQQVVVQLPPLGGLLQRPLQVSGPQPQVRDRVVVTCLKVSLF